MRKKNIKGLWELTATVVLFSLAVITGKISPYTYTGQAIASNFESVLHGKEAQMVTLFDHLSEDIEDFDTEDFYSRNFYQIDDQIKSEGLYVFIYHNDSLKFWSDNTIQVDQVINNHDSTENLVFLGNGWYVKKSRKYKDTELIGLILIKTEYPYENKYLKNRFHKDFTVPPNTIIVKEPVPDIHIHDLNNQFIFSLDISGAPAYSNNQIYFAIVCYFVSIILFLLYSRHFIMLFPRGSSSNFSILLLFPIYLIVYWIYAKIALPGHFSHVPLFLPSTYAASNWFPSLGNLLIFTLFTFFLVYYFYSEFRLSDDYLGKHKNIRVGIIIVFLTLLVVSLQGINALFRSLVIHSNITFETFKVLDISLYTFLGFLILAFHYSAFALLTDKFISLFNPAPTRKNLLIYLLSFILMSYPACYLIGLQADPFILIFPAVILSVMILARYYGSLKYRYSTFVLLVFLFSIFVVYQIIEYSSEKEKNRKVVLVLDLSSERDPVAELLLKEIEDEIESDEKLEEMLLSPFFSEEEIYNYITREYFSGFWGKYDLQFTVCNPTDNVYIEPPDDTVRHCYNFFDEFIDRTGIRIPGSDFYFIDNVSGRISYFASFKYYSPDSLEEVTLFLELDSKLISEGLGYPELLLSEQFMGVSALENYSYAKYHRGELITQSGSFPYSLRRDVYSSGEKEFEYLRYDNFDHLIYNIDEENTVIISNPRLKLLDVLITFTYVFVFFYILVTINLLAVNIRFFRSSFQPSIKNRIQYSMILVLVLSLFLIGGGTIYFSARQYKQRHYKSLSERIQSVYIELIHKLQFEQDLSEGWYSEDYRNLDELLRKFSNVFYTDINLYDPAGNLLATSRSEIFDRGLFGLKINPAAYLELVVNDRNEFVHEERIGKLDYLSAYVPFKNSENKLLAYLNLPYFTRHNDLTREISNLVVAIVNFYVLLASLGILLAIFLSTRITHPLRMIQSQFGKITLGKTNAKIQYAVDDEVGGLVREYNLMVDELAKSAELLARSERESAWREMAKQIAHEIKNPLTPMKLSVQHLQRAWKDDPEKWEKNLEKISKTLVEQIDNLSDIATEFSNFAQMPKAKNEEVDLITKINNTVRLFANAENVEFKIEFHGIKKAVVIADKEQLSRVFINLFKNAVQSIPEGRHGIVEIQLHTTDHTAIIKVTDNGKGIPGDIGDKLFQPNFTTKSGGMGMGLAISKDIVENAGGKISYETIPGKGTTFIIELPLLLTTEDINSMKE